MSKPYNGHPSYNAWNVALWIGNDEGLYNAAKYYRRVHGLRGGAEAFIAQMERMGQPRTGEGVRWTVTNVMRAMRDL